MESSLLQLLFSISVSLLPIPNSVLAPFSCVFCTHFLLQLILFLAKFIHLMCVVHQFMSISNKCVHTQSGMRIHVKNIVDFIYFRFYDRAIRSRTHISHPLDSSLSPLTFAIVNSSNPIQIEYNIYIRKCVVCVSSVFQQLSRSVYTISVVGPALNSFGPATFKWLSVQCSHCKANLFKWQSFHRYWPLFKYSIRHEMTPTITKQPQSEHPKCCGSF